MSHALEQMEDGTYRMAYAGEVPWHGHGQKVPYDVTPLQMLEAAGLDWTVSKSDPLSVKINGHTYKSDDCFLLRSDREGLGAIIGLDKEIKKAPDTVSVNWEPIQNNEAADFFNGMVMAGDAQMETAGSLYNGEIVWFMARMKESFDLFKGKDVIDCFMVFTNPHKYAMSQSTMITTCRVVCRNTHRIAYSEASQAGDIVKHRHRTKFDAEKTMIKMGYARERIAKYKEAALQLSKKKAKKEDIVEYFKRVLPAYQNKSGKDLSKNAQLALDILETQPGAELGAGTWWQPYNAVTFLIDHHIGKTDESRIFNSMWGTGVRTKDKALEVALEMAV